MGAMTPEGVLVGGGGGSSGVFGGTESVVGAGEEGASGSGDLREGIPTGAGVGGSVKTGKSSSYPGRLSSSLKSKESGASVAAAGVGTAGEGMVGIAVGMAGVGTAGVGGVTVGEGVGGLPSRSVGGGGTKTAVGAGEINTSCSGDVGSPDVGA